MNGNAKKGKTEQGRVVLAYGEVTGHAHAFYGDDVAELDGNKLTIKRDGAQLVHEEHTKHTFAPGQAEVTIQREYRMGSLRRVAD